MAQTNSKKIALIIITGNFILSAVFIYAAYSKIMDPENFIKDIKQYEILPHALLNPFGHSLPFLEIIAAIALWIPFTKNAALTSLGLMLLMFISAISFAILTNKDINCGCFSSDHQVGLLQLTIDLILFLDIIMLFYLSKKNKPITPTNGA